jgi:hypothetical protein
MNWKQRKKKRSWPNLGSNSDICLCGLIPQNVNQNSCFLIVVLGVRSRDLHVRSRRNANITNANINISDASDNKLCYRFHSICWCIGSIA